MDISTFCIFFLLGLSDIETSEMAISIRGRWSVEPRNQWVSPRFSNKEPWWCRWQTWYFHENPVAMTLLSEGSNLMDEGDLELAKQCVLADDSQCFATFWVFSVCLFCVGGPIDLLFVLFCVISYYFALCFPISKAVPLRHPYMDEASYMQPL